MWQTHTHTHTHPHTLQKYTTQDRMTEPNDTVRWIQIQRTEQLNAEKRVLCAHTHGRVTFSIPPHLLLQYMLSSQTMPNSCYVQVNRLSRPQAG